MIKVNLLKDAGNKKLTESTIFDSKIKNSFTSVVVENNALVKRIFFLVMPFIAVFIYTWFIESGLQSNIDNLNTQVAAVDAQMQSLKAELDTVERLKKEKNKLLSEVDAIKSLSRKRYAYVKVLDSLQSLIPEKAWITKLSFKDKMISIDGRATEDSVISYFMQNLEESAYFSNVTWVNSSEVNEPQGLVKSFSIRFNLENI